MLDRIRRKAREAHPIWLYAGLIVLALAFGLPLCRRAIILSDEGYLLQQSLDLLGGRVIYRDMDAFITPGMWFLIAGAFSVFEPSVWTSRMLILVAYVALVLVGFRIVERIAGRAYGLAAVLSLLLFSVWAFPAWTFAFYSPMAVLFALIGLERLLAWQESGARRDLLLVGVWMGLSICFKQNYGVFAAIGAGIGWLATRFAARASGAGAGRGAGADLGVVAGGMLAAGSPFLAYLVYHGALPDAWQSLVVHPFEFGGKHDIPYAPLSDLWKADLYKTAVDKLTYLSYAMHRASPVLWLHSIRAVHRLHTLAYWLPPLIFCAGALLALLPTRSRQKGIDAPLFSVVSTCGLLFLGVLPRADFNHLVNVYQPVLVTAPIVLHRAFGRLRDRPAGLRITLGGTVALLAASYGGVAILWYAMLLRGHDTLIGPDRGGVLVPSAQAQSIDQQVRLIRDRSEPGDAVLMVPDLSMLSFLAERRVPSPYYNLYEHHIAGDLGAAVVAGSEENGVDIVVTRYDNFFSDRVGLLDYAPLLSDYIITHFERELIGAGERYVIYRRREQPLPEHDFVDVLANCESSEGRVQIARHLLFAALYHKSHPREPIPTLGLTTACRVRVPESGGFLSLEYGYRPPHLLQRGTRLQVWIAVRDGGREQRILKETIRVIRDDGRATLPPYRQVDLDLSRWAGREVEIVFHTELFGQVLAHPHDLKGFGMVWRDPRILEEAGGARP